MNSYKLTAFLIFSLLFCSLNAAEMVITKPIIEVSGDLTLHESPKRDFSGEFCALVKINTDLVLFDKIESNRTPVDVENKTSEVWVYLSPGEKQLYFAKKGFARLNYKIPLKLESNKVYTMTIMGKGDGLTEIDNVVSLTFNLNVEGIYLSRDNKAPILTTSNVALFRLPKGKYNFQIEKQGYQTQTKEIDLQHDEDVDIILEAGASQVSFSAPGIITIESEPIGAEVELNGQKVGTTPYQGSHYAGEYTLTIRKDLYYSTSKTFALKKGETLDIPSEKLKPRFGYWKVTCKPSNASIYLDDKFIDNAPLAKKKIRSGEHTLRLTKDNYKAHEETFIVKDGDEPEFNITLKPNYASLEVNTAPEQGATVFIDNEKVGTTPYTFDMMPAGKYNLRVEKELWSGISEIITIEPEIPVKKTLVLTKNFGNLIVTAPECKILLDNEFVGTTSIERNLKPGSYTVTATREKYKNDEKKILVSVGETTSVNLYPIPKLGSISIFAVDKRNPLKKIKGADIFVNNEKSKKRTPSVLELLYGDYNLLVTKPGYLDVTKSINLKEEEKKSVIFEMDTYSGSKLAKRNSWRVQGWLGLSSSLILAGAGVYFNLTGDEFYKEYQNSTTTADAISARENTDKFYQYRDYSYYVSIVPAIWSIYSWFKQAHYNK